MALTVCRCGFSLSRFEVQSLTRNVRDYDFFGNSDCRKNRKNPILGISNVDPKPEPNVQKKFFSVIYPFEKHFT